MAIGTTSTLPLLNYTHDKATIQSKQSLTSRKQPPTQRQRVIWPAGGAAQVGGGGGVTGGTHPPVLLGFIEHYNIIAINRLFDDRDTQNEETS